MAVEVGQVLDGKYRIVRLVGKGGMGAVYEAEHLLIDRRVAVKELHAEAASAEHAITRFEREARAAGRIGSDHILQIFDVGVLPDGSRYMVSELLDGETLAARIERVGQLAPAELLPIAQQLLVGLGAAHAAGVLHRDLKPDNIFLVRKSGISDFVKIIDFGIAKFQHGIHQEDALKMTKTGVVVGTPYYLPPEQARGTGEADARSDLYSVGVILYECLTGRVPFESLSFNDLLFKIVLEKPEPPAVRTPGIDQRLSDLVLKTMAREPAARFQSAHELLHALSEWAASAEGAAALALAPRPSRVASDAQVSTRQAPLGVSPGRGVASSGGFSTVAAPTPASFGATRDPKYSLTPAPPARSILPLALLGGGAVLLIFGGGFFLLRSHGREPALAASTVSPAASSTREGSHEAPGPAVQSGLPALNPEAVVTRESEPASTSEVTSAKARATLPPTAAPRRVPPVLPAQRSAPTEPKPTPAGPKVAPPEAKAAPPEPKPAPRRPDIWGY